MGKTRNSANLVSDNNISVDIINDRVGIGTINPQYKLDVLGDINFTGTFRQNGNSFVASRWTSGTGDNIYRLSGNVGIGTTNPSTKLDVNGTITCADINSTSDIKLKDNIETFSNALEIVEGIRGVRFEWKKDQKPSIGVIAQELEEVLPELVSQNDPKTVNYNGLIGVMIEAIKEQQTQINTLKEEIQSLKQ
jgi:hypothetical protein